MLRNYFSIAAAICISMAYAAPKNEVKSTIEAVTVFLNGAQVTRTFDLSLSAGTEVVRVTGLSPYLDPRSIQLKGDGDFTILSIRHQMNYLDLSEVDQELKIITDSLEHYQRMLAEFNDELAVLAQSESFLNANRDVNGSENIQIDQLTAIHDYFFKQMTSIKARKTEIGYAKARITERLMQYRRQLGEINARLSQSTSEVLIEIKSENRVSGEFQLSFLVNHAGWFPSYDVKVKEVGKPLQLVYKANVRQSSGIDWKNVELTFSNANPYEKGDLPILTPYHLNYASMQASGRTDQSKNSYNLSNYISSVGNQAGGQIVDQNGHGIAYATIRVNGTSVGSLTDENGYFDISLPQGKNQLYITAIGYEQSYPVVQATNSNRLVLRSSEQQVVISDRDYDGVADSYNQVTLQSKDITRLPTRSLGIAAISLSRKKYKSQPITVLPLENQTTLEITLDVNFTVISGDKPKVISMRQEEIPAYYEYRSVPKLEQAAFLIARIVDWSAYDLLQGEANLYFENTYIGKSLLDVRYLNDTLNISLGRDKSVLVSRQKVRSASTREFIGNDKIEKREFEIKVRNHKGQPINLIVYDQVPLSQRPKDIIVDIKSTDGARYVDQTGELSWSFKLDPNQDKTMKFKYQVKYPKNQNINLE